MSTDKKTAFSFNDLSSTEFESFTYDLLCELGFTDLSWRKGTGLDAHTPDQGRDIEASFVRIEVDGNQHLERWFFQCKHFKEGVPPDKLASGLTWAMAERPDKLVFVVSNFLSNPSKNHLESYRLNNKPTFRIVVWELPKLEELTVTKLKIARKYGLVGSFPHLSLIHPAHAAYLKNTKPNSLAYFLSLMDRVDRNRLGPFFDHTAEAVINPRMRPATRRHETLADLVVDDTSYPAFRQKCLQLGGLVNQSFLVSSIVKHMLQGLLRSADIYAIDQDIRFYQSWITTLRDTPDDPELPVDRASRERGIAMYQSWIDDKPRTTKEALDTYQYFCDQVVAKLLDEELSMATLEQLRNEVRRLERLP